MTVTTRRSRALEAINKQRIDRSSNTSNNRSSGRPRITISPQMAAAASKTYDLVQKKRLEMVGTPAGDQFILFKSSMVKTLSLSIDLMDQKNLLESDHFPLVDGAGDLPFPLNIFYRAGSTVFSILHG